MTIEEIQKLDKQIVDIKIKSGSKKDLQTFKFVADEFNVDINKVVKWFIICLISVFDPLAICLLLAYNTTLGDIIYVKFNVKKEETIEKESTVEEIVKQAKEELSTVGFYNATENAALEHFVSVPELQRLITNEGLNHATI